MRTTIGLLLVLWGVSSASADPIVAVALGDAHSCALRRSGQVACWGSDLVGQLGDGAREDHAQPRPLVGLEGATQIAAFGARSCAVLRSGHPAHPAVQTPDHPIPPVQPARRRHDATPNHDAA